MADETLKGKLLQEIYDCTDELHNIELGTDKHSKAVEDICKLCNAYENDFKVENEFDFQNSKIENERIRDQEELEIKRLQAEIESRKHLRIKPDTIFNAMVIVGLTVGCCTFEAKGHIFPAKMLKYVDKIKLTI